MARWNAMCEMQNANDVEGWQTAERFGFEKNPALSTEATEIMTI